MSIIVGLNKYISVPILLHWLSADELLIFLASVSSKSLLRTLAEWILEFDKQFEDKLCSSQSVYHLSSSLIQWFGRWNIRFLNSMFIFDTTEVLEEVHIERLFIVNSDDRHSQYIKPFMSMMGYLHEFHFSSPGESLLPELSFRRHLHTFRLDCQAPHSERYIRDICGRCPNLTDLKVSNVHEFSTVCSVVIYCRRLRHLMMLVSMRIHPYRYQSLFVLHCKCPLETLGISQLAFRSAMFYQGNGLKELHLSAIDGRTMSLNGVQFPQLRVLEYVNFQTASATVPWHSVPNLTSLSLSVTDSSLLELTEICTSLRSLKIYTADTYAQIKKESLLSVTKLIHMETFHCYLYNAAEEVLLAIVSACTTISVLHIRRSTLTHKFCESLQRLPGLTQFYARECGLDNVSATTISQCKELKSLTLEKPFTSASIDSFLQMPKLLFLDVGGKVKERISCEKVKEFNKRKHSKYLRYVVMRDGRQRSLFSEIRGNY